MPSEFTEHLAFACSYVASHDRGPAATEHGAQVKDLAWSERAKSRSLAMMCHNQKSHRSDLSIIQNPILRTPYSVLLRVLVIGAHKNADRAQALALRGCEGQRRVSRLVCLWTRLGSATTLSNTSPSLQHSQLCISPNTTLSTPSRSYDLHELARNFHNGDRSFTSANILYSQREWLSARPSHSHPKRRV